VTVTVQLNAELEVKLLAEARAQGISLDAYIADVVTHAAASDGRHEITLRDLEAGLDELAEGSERGVETGGSRNGDCAKKLGKGGQRT
jgi:hypothetical protein